jgi:hypothetical protein
MQQLEKHTRLCLDGLANKRCLVGQRQSAWGALFQVWLDPVRLDLWSAGTGGDPRDLLDSVTEFG